MDEKDKLIQNLLDRILQLEKIVVEQAAKIAELEKRLEKNSQNSSKPPSSDGFKKRPQNNREKTNKKTGGQQGHEGLTLKRGTPHKSHLLPVLCCAHCGDDLSGNQVTDIEARQVHDMPQLKLRLQSTWRKRNVAPVGKQRKPNFQRE